MKTLFLASFSVFGLAAASMAFAQDAGNGTTDTDNMSELMDRGAVVYERDCQSCHGVEGQGGAGLPLAGSGFLEDEIRTIKQITQGGGFMPGFPTLGDYDVAAVATYIRNSFGNSFGVVTEADAAANR